jgi:polyhydroxybutyrate depolymerase
MLQILVRWLAAACAAIAPAALRAQGDTLRHFTMEAVGARWSVNWWAPDGATPRPLVLVLHGAGGEGRAYLEKNGWWAKARAEGFVVVAPDGQPARAGARAHFLTNPRLWNSGQLVPGSPRTQLDDVAFVRALLDELARRTPVDPARIFVTGHSNGAAMAFRLGVELSDRIAAIAPVMGQDYVVGAVPARARPTLYLLGDRDKLNPLDGGPSRLPWGTRTTPPLARSIAAWATSLGCPDLPARVRDDDTVLVRRWSGCRDGATYDVWLLKGQGHGWPGGRESGLPDWALGPSRNAVNATDEAWRFFAAVPRQD